MVEEEKEEKKLCGLLSQRAYFTFVIVFTLICAFIACGFLVFIIKTSGPSDPVITYGEWSECRPNKTMKRSVLCGRAYCYTEVESCVYKGWHRLDNLNISIIFSSFLQRHLGVIGAFAVLKMVMVPRLENGFAMMNLIVKRL